MGNISRSMAFQSVLVILGGTLVGSVLPEFGNLLAKVIGFPNNEGHIFNPSFLVIGIAGIVLALCFRFKRGRK